MKNFLLLTAAAFTALSMNAQLYVVGEGVQGNPGWTPDAATEITAQNGVYTFTSTGNFKISTARGTWDQFNGAAYTMNGTWNKGTNTATANLQPGDGDFQHPMNGTEVTFTVPTDFSTITATLPAGMSFQDAPEPDFYLIGVCNGWGLKDAAYKMTKQGGGVYTYSVTTSMPKGWKINDGTWGLNFGQGGSAPVIGDETVVYFNGSDIQTAVPAGSVITFKYVDGGASTLLITNDNPNPPTPAVEDVLLIGDFNNWDQNDLTSAKFTKTADNTYTLHFDSFAAGEFKVKTAEANWDTSWGAPGDSPVITVGTPKDAWLGSSINFYIGENLTNATFTFTRSDDGSIAGSLLVTADQDPVPPTPAVEDLVLIGDFNNWDQNDLTTYKFTKTGDNTYTLNLATFPAGTFKVKTAEANWDTSWGAAGANPNVENGEPAEAWLGSSENFILAQTLKDATVNFTRSDDGNVAGTLNVSGTLDTSAIESVEASAEAAPAEYYNLQGIRVAAPVSGQVYILRQGNRVSKVIK